MSPRTLAAGLLLGTLAVLSPLPAQGGESGAERLYRKGVHCMEEIERPECAIEHFEALLDERTTQRELVTDGLLRLVKLYEKADRPDDLKAALRRFWDAGKTDVRRGHLPYTARFLPKDFDVVFHAHIQRLLAAPLAKKLDDIAEYVMTCDPNVRNQLDDVRIYRKAQRKAKETGITVQKAMSQVVAEEKKEAEQRKQRRAKAEADGTRPRRPEPVFADATCQVARALGDDTAAAWTRGAFALAHKDFRRSAAILEIPDLANKLAAAAAAGKLVARGEGTWALTPLRYEGGEVLLRPLETGELVVAPPAVMTEIVANHSRGKRTLLKEVDRLVTGVPVDAGFFAVVTEDAVRDLGFGSSGGRRTLLQLLLPRPEGLQMAGVAHDYFGFFLRMPTDTPLKAGALVGIAQRMIAAQAEEDEESADFLRLLDVTQATDKRALLLSYVLSRRQIETIVLR